MTNAQHPSFDSSQPSQQALELGVLERVFADAVADRVADLLSSQLRSVDLVDAATLATTLNVSRDWVYAHSAELGGIRIGPGNRGRLRFDLGRVLDIWRASERTEPGSEVQRPHNPRTQRVRRISSPSEGELLPIRQPRGRRRQTVQR
jgi:hypothetical protein